MSTLNWFMRPSHHVAGTPKELELVYAAFAPLMGSPK
jgi:hypothetical protein